jgi:succinate dehydrogenase hydrophobic anchor subunit
MPGLCTILRYIQTFRYRRALVAVVCFFLFGLALSGRLPLICSAKNWLLYTAVRLLYSGDVARLHNSPVYCMCGVCGVCGVCGLWCVVCGVWCVVSF